MFKTIKNSVQSELVEKKSKFIANLYYVQSVQEAEDIIKENKKKYFDARHNCFAYRIMENNNIVERFSDDGEPSGTAGAPMLAMLEGNNLANVLIIVTRYFGGILLGTGGLIRAYTGSLENAINLSDFIKKELGIQIELEVTYSDLEKLKYYFKVKDVKIVNSEYYENVKIIAEMIKEKFDEIIENQNELNFDIKSIKILSEKYITI